MTADIFTFFSENLSGNCRIINEADFFRSGILLPFFQKDGQWHLLFEKRAEQIRQGGEVGFPGGKFDENEDQSTADTALRETVEELRIPAGNIEMTGLFGTFVGTMGVLIDAYIGKISLDSLDSVDFSRAEVEDIFSIPFSYFLETEPSIYSADMEIRSIRKQRDGSLETLFPAKDLGLPERYHYKWRGKSQSIYVYPTEPYTVWGITAKIIMNLVNRYKNG